MAHSPVVLAAYAAMSQAIATHASFDACTREAIALAVGNVDGCDYCQATHTLSAITAGFEQDQTIAIRAGEVDFDDKLAALLAVVREAARWATCPCDLEGRSGGGLDRTRAG